MIYDCFTFFNELDLLEIRLNILNDIVDKFVIVEMNKTFTGENKSLYYQENKARFNKFDGKIIHVIVDDCPETDNAWALENYQRNCISRGLKNCQSDDIIMISDLDEIPNPEIIANLDCSSDIYLLEQKMYYYFLNYLNIKSPIWYSGTKVLSYQNFLHGLDNIDVKYSKFMPEEQNSGTTANKIRHFGDAKYIKNGGWHFSYLGGVDMIIKKIKSFSHQEFNKAEYTNKDLILKRIASGKDIFNRSGCLYVPVSLDNSFPEYLVNNQEKYKFLIFQMTIWDKLKSYLKIYWCTVMKFLYYKEKINTQRKIYILGVKMFSYNKN